MGCSGVYGNQSRSCIPNQTIGTAFMSHGGVGVNTPSRIIGGVYESKSHCTAHFSGYIIFVYTQL